jgi:hypothetical protein
MSRPGDICDSCFEAIDEGRVTIFHVSEGRAISKFHQKCELQLRREATERP